MVNGWIKLHRKICEWEWYSDTNTFHLFIHFLLHANHEPRHWRGIDIDAGQLLTSRESLALQTGISERGIRTSLEKLKSTNEVTIKSTNKYSIITIVKWSEYQLIDQQATSKRPAKRHLNDQQTDQQDILNMFEGTMTYNDPITQNDRQSDQQTDQQDILKSTTNKNIRIKELKKEPLTPLPEWLPSNEWEAFKEMRKQKREPMTANAERIALSTLLRLLQQGNEPKAVIEQSILNGWKGFFPLKTSGMAAKPIRHTEQRKGVIPI